MKGRENPSDAPPTRTMKSRALFVVWKGIFCVYVLKRDEKVVILINAHHNRIYQTLARALTFPGAFSAPALSGADLEKRRRNIRDNILASW